MERAGKGGAGSDRRDATKLGGPGPRLCPQPLEGSTFLRGATCLQIPVLEHSAGPSHRLRGPNPHACQLSFSPCLASILKWLRRSLLLLLGPLLHPLPLPLLLNMFLCSFYECWLHCYFSTSFCCLPGFCCILSLQLRFPECFLWPSNFAAAAAAAAACAFPCLLRLLLEQFPCLLHLILSLKPFI